MSHNVFISYASEDEQVARRIVEFLQGHGLRCWIDQQNLRFTGKYDREIERAIGAAAWSFGWPRRGPLPATT